MAPQQTCRFIVACTVSAIGLAGLSACAAVPDPGPPPLDSATKPIRVSVNPDDVEQRVLGRLYTQALAHSGRRSLLVIANKPRTWHPENVGVVSKNRQLGPRRHSVAHADSDIPPTPGDRISRLNQLQGDLVVGCTGELFALLDPQGAAALSKMYMDHTAGAHTGKEKNLGTWREKTYRAMVNSLPGNMMASDPSSATACADRDHPRLPQNVVAIFRKPMLDRDDRLVLNKVGGTITTAELNDLVKASSMSSASLVASVDAYMRAHDL